MPIQPSSFIVPLFKGDRQPVFLGTAFFLQADEQHLVTAYHCIRGHGEQFIFSYVSESTGKDRLMPWSPAIVDKVCPTIDLALLRATGYKPSQNIRLPSTDEVHLNEFVVCHEFSQTTVASAERKEIVAQPSSRIGNIVSVLDRTDILGAAGHDILELSFAAMKGSSGAPVVSRKNQALQGMILQNVQHHLLPAHIEKIVDETGEVAEETQFMLPQALALNVKHIRAEIAS